MAAKYSQVVVCTARRSPATAVINLSADSYRPGHRSPSVSGPHAGCSALRHTLSHFLCNSQQTEIGLRAPQALVSELKAAQEWLPKAEEQLPADAAVAKAKAETRLTADKLAAAEAQCQHLQAAAAANEILLKRLEVATLPKGQLRALLLA